MKHVMIKITISYSLIFILHSMHVITVCISKTNGILYIFAIKEMSSLYQ